MIKITPENYNKFVDALAKMRALPKPEVQLIRELDKQLTEYDKSIGTTHRPIGNYTAAIKPTK